MYLSFFAFSAMVAVVVVIFGSVLFCFVLLSYCTVVAILYEIKLGGEVDFSTNV